MLRPAAVLAAALALGGCRCSSSIGAEELARIRASLVFVNEGAGTSQVHVFLADGGSGPLTTGPRNHFPLVAWRGGLAVVASEGDGDAHVEQLHWLAPDGGLIALQPESRRARSVVPTTDGKALLMESGAVGFSEIVRVDLDGATALTSNPEGNFEPQALPDGGFVCVSSRDGNPELYRGSQRLTSDPAEDLAPRVSPDGSTIAFLSSRRGSDEIFVMPATGGDARPLLSGPLPSGPAQAAPREALQRDLSFSPDGKAIWFTGRAGKGRLRVWRADVATGRATALTDGSADDDQPRLSPDGRWVAWVSTRDGNPELYVARTDGTGTTRLTTHPGPDWLPVWR